MITNIISAISIVTATEYASEMHPTMREIIGIVIGKIR